MGVHHRHGHFPQVPHHHRGHGHALARAAPGAAGPVASDARGALSAGRRHGEARGGPSDATRITEDDCTTHHSIYGYSDTSDSLTIIKPMVFFSDTNIKYFMAIIEQEEAGYRIASRSFLVITG